MAIIEENIIVKITHIIDDDFTYLFLQAGVCPYCEGTGQETVKTGHIIGRRQCSYCHGEKLFIRFKCIECEGIGRKIYDIQYPIELPPGCEHGQGSKIFIGHSIEIADHSHIIL